MVLTPCFSRILLQWVKTTICSTEEKLGKVMTVGKAVLKSMLHQHHAVVIHQRLHEASFKVVKMLNCTGCRTTVN